MGVIQPPGSGETDVVEEPGALRAIVDSTGLAAHCEQEAVHVPKTQEDWSEAEAKANFEGEAEGTSEGGVNHGSVKNYGLVLGA